MDFRFTPEEEEFRQEVRAWMAQHLVGVFAEHLGVGGPADDTHWDLRLAWEKELAAGGWLGITWPKAYGGRGGTLNEEIIFQFEQARARAPYRVGIQGHDLFGPMLLEFGSDQQKLRFLPPILRVEEFWGQGFSEPDAGSDLGSVRTRAALDGDEWVVNGQKVWTTLGAHADWLWVLCRTDPAAAKHKGLSLLLLPADQPGVDVRTIRTIAGTHEFCEVFFNDARTEAGLAVGEVNGGWGVVMGALGRERATTTLPYQAAFEREVERLIEIVRQRGLQHDPVVRQRVAEAWIGLHVLRCNNYRMLTGIMRNGTLGPESSVAKLYWSNWHRRLGELEMELMGPASEIVGKDYELDPFQTSFLNSRAETIYGGSNEIQRNVVGERVLGLPKEPT